MRKRDLSLIVIPIFLIIVALALIALSGISTATDDEQRTLIESTVRRCAVECYALEGSYPKDIEYIKAEYGLTYDSERYFVHYLPLGSNLMPEIKVFLIDK